ncbi:sigma-E factor negative regulatory protein [Candidatus Sororendozoicomonas aggregata]|uniref:sigma-E factor negative regulatory protein n=1 Tax=Candidatus Sororendozoicomonas aggregata TaxID=3073239 RepID=UPI002ED3D1F0
MSEKNAGNQSSERLHDALSAVMDGQASEFEMHRVLDSLQSNDALREAAIRYQRIGDTLRHETNRFADIDISRGVMAAIDQEEKRSSRVNERIEKTRFLGAGSFARLMESMNGAFGRVAIAASVVFAVVLGTRSYNSDSVTPEALVADAGNNSMTLSQPIQVNAQHYGGMGILAGYGAGHQSESISPEQIAYAQRVADRATRERFRAYALQHAELSAMTKGQGVLPFARLTSFDVQ